MVKGGLRAGRLSLGGAVVVGNIGPCVWNQYGTVWVRITHK